MTERTQGMREEKSGRPVWLKRMGWLVLIWCLSVVGLGAVAWLLRLFMQAAGLSG